MGVLALILLLGIAAASPSGLRCREGSPILDVPQSAWTSLNEKVSGRLHSGRPYGLPCFETYQNSTGTFPNALDSERCATIQSGLTKSDTLVTDFGSYHSASFGSCMATGEHCTLSPSVLENPKQGTCHQGSVPDYYVEVSGVEDIQAALSFANEYNLPITIKNTGHDYKGRSAAPNTFGIWTHNLRPEIALDEQFIPEGCSEPVGAAITYGAGEMWAGVYDFVKDSGYLVVGGTCPTVGAAGGWIQGGGHGPYSPTYGLGVDNNMQMKVVLPNGTYVTANRCQNQDIYFALRGGGGGTFGVVTEVSTKVHKDTAFTFASLGMAIPTGSQEITEIFVKNAAKWAEEGWGGYLGFGAGNTVTFIGITPRVTVEEAQDSLKPIYEYFDSVSNGGAIAYRKNITSLPSQAAFQRTPESIAFGSKDIGSMIAQSSRLVPKETFEDESTQKALVDILVQKGIYGALLVTPYVHDLAESDKTGNVGQSALTPAWRTSPWHLVYQTIFDPADSTKTSSDALTKIFSDVSKDMDKIREITPNGGAYMGEGDTFEPNHIASYWGQQNYDRLLKIKNQVDPKNLLSCYKCVGWKETEDRHKCYPKI
ncbi:unnamed protein product [Clonostachys rosea]|uniref:FAD-binding PCMH-type domain-containing protein n=1 Tax=Bionectria ochroleuca TaxID=29856 RepID=A0ABY6V5N2_BIOOC|nr:unnamed protein product [Clonostachys rosea]